MIRTKEIPRLSCIAIIYVICLFHLLQAQGTSTPSNQYNFIKAGSIIQQKNYYLLTLLQELAPVRKMLEQDSELIRITSDKIYSLSHAQEQCNQQNRFCYTEKMKFSNDEINSISRRLAANYTNDNPLGKLVTEHLIPSGTYILYANLSPLDMLIKAWEQDARGINFVISVYAEGAKPKYPKIDSINFNVSSRQFVNTVKKASKEVLRQAKNSQLFFGPSLQFALKFLDENNWENAADWEPLESTINKNAIARIKNIKWDEYNFSVILIPGAGPENPRVHLTEEGKERCRIAAVHYKNKRAPFLIVSGGKVHPYKTQYCEAFEMKKYLVDSLKIPEDAIITEPHARHTITNIRNTSRLIFRYGIPFNKSCLVTTSAGQSFYIHELSLEKKGRQELGYMTFKKGMRLSKYDVVFYPVINALQINPLEPLDP